jgi:hypothetical protein
MDSQYIYCCYCGQPIGLPDLTREHLVPKSWGGNNSDLNIKHCCKLCNQKRANKSLKKWLSELTNELIVSKNIEQKKYSLEIMIENVGYWNEYIERFGIRLYKSEDLCELKSEMLMTA